MNEQNALQILQNNRDEILLFEISALIHDLGKLSEEFVLINSRNKPANLEYKHNLILLKILSQIPSSANKNTQAEVLEWYKNSHFADQIQRDILQELLSSNLDKTDDKISISLRQARDNMEKQKYASNPDFDRAYQQLRAFRLQIAGELNILQAGFWSDLSERTRQILADDLSISVPLHNGEQLNLKAIGDILEQHDDTWHEEIKDLDNAVLTIRAKSNGCDGVDSGNDKGTAAAQQDHNYTFISSAFGYESEDNKIGSQKLWNRRNLLLNR